MLRRPFSPFFLPLLCFVSHWPSFVRIGVFDQTVCLPAFVVFGKIFSYGESILINKKHSMAILVNLHVVAGADPCTVFNLFIFVWIKSARAQGPTNLVYVLGKAEYHLFSNTFDRRYGGAGFFAIFLYKDAHPLYRFCLLYTSPSPRD